MQTISSLLCALLPLAAPGEPNVPSARARELAESCAVRYADRAVETLAELVAFDTFRREGVANAEHPSFRAMTARLRELAAELELDFADHGAVVVIGLGDAEERLGVLTHGDVTPVQADRWARDPFQLDRESEPGRLVGRGTEDDKGPIVCALYAMRTLREAGLPLRRRIELVVSYTEESDWTPFREFLEAHPPPELNVAFDAEYPVVVAEKGWCSIDVALPLVDAPAPDGPRLASFTGGSFLGQVPESARAVVARPTLQLEARLLERAREDEDVRFRFTPGPHELVIEAQGISSHSSKPEQGRNAITHLARLLACHDWPADARGRMVRFLDERVGTGFHGELFGRLAYRDPFMGPLTLSLGVLQEEQGKLRARINLRRPVGRTVEEVEASITEAVETWADATGTEGLELTTYVGMPHPPVDAPHVPVLLETFRAFTGERDAQPIAIGGGTHARLVPNGVNFGPSMPGEPYTGHSEHEFLSYDQLVLNLRMYTSLLADLAGGDSR